MQCLHLTCCRDHLSDLVDTLTRQFAEREGVQVLDYGISAKGIQGYLVVGWDGDGEDAFIDHLIAHHEILDLSVFTLPCTTTLDCSPLLV